MGFVFSDAVVDDSECEQASSTLANPKSFGASLGGLRCKVRFEAIGAVYTPQLNPESASERSAIHVHA
jgi:hypothetical protein